MGMLFVMPNLGHIILPTWFLRLTHCSKHSRMLQWLVDGESHEPQVTTFVAAAGCFSADEVVAVSFLML